MAKDTKKVAKVAKAAGTDKTEKTEKAPKVEKVAKLPKPVTAHIPVRGAKGAVILVEVKAREAGVSKRGNKVFKVTPARGVGEMTMTEAQLQFAV